MNTTTVLSNLERFRAAIGQTIGLQFDDAKLGFLGEVLQRRLDFLGQPSTDYLRGLEQAGSAAELGALARELTVGETYFFRNIEQFRAFGEVVLPQRMKARKDSQTLRFASAGCASGEEAYSMAIITREIITDPAWRVAIRAVDLNPAFLEKAARARYSAWALRNTPPEVQSKWFHSSGRDFALNDELIQTVKIEFANLVSETCSLWQPGAYDAVFCRNVLMYFSPEQMRTVIAHISRSLAPGGFLFLGHAESLRGVSNRFHLHHSHGTFYYELKEGAEARPAQPAPALTPLSLSGAALSIVREPRWFNAISKASERVAGLVPAAKAGDVVACTSPPRWDPAPALDLLHKERFAEALLYVRSRPPAEAKDPDVLLLEATLLAHSGELVAAEDVCLQLLLVDEFNAGAHYVLALCREHSGHLQQAIEHDRVAAYLNHAFAMPRLHWGLLANRTGDRVTARRELRQALELLKREAASRLLLFGGGFHRKALMALCEAALKEGRTRT